MVNAPQILDDCIGAGGFGLLEYAKQTLSGPVNRFSISRTIIGLENC